MTGNRHSERDNAGAEDIDDTDDLDAPVIPATLGTERDTSATRSRRAQPTGRRANGRQGTPRRRASGGRGGRAGRAADRFDRAPRGRAVALVALVALAALIVAALIAGNGLVSCGNQRPIAKVINLPVTAEQANRLAGMRLANYAGAHAAVHVTIGNGASAVHLTGWVNWRTQLIYLNSLGAKPGPSDGMLQALPGIIAVRPGRYTPPATTGSKTVYDPYPAPPVLAPPTGWQIRGFASGSPIDTMVTLLFALRSTTADSASEIASIGTRFVGTDEIAGDKVDILDGAAVPPPAPKASTTGGPTAATPAPSHSGLPFAAYGGQVRYWVDAHSRLLRAEALVSPAIGLRIDFDQTDGTEPTAIELLGGAPIRPTKLTAKQADVLASMRFEDGQAKGGAITLAVPASADELLSATGWIDWPDTALYLTVRNVKAGGPDALVRADATGLTIHGSIDGTPLVAGQAENRAPLAVPAVPAPTTGWKRVTWASREDAYGEPDFDLILNEMLALWAPAKDDPAALLQNSSRLRSDSVGGVPVTVFEIRKPAERGVIPGRGRLRYWVDAHGLLRRLEIRTRTGAWAYLTFTPGAFPRLPDPIQAKP